MKTYDQIAALNNVECIYHDEIQEYHCGRLQGITKVQAFAKAQSEGISYERFRMQGGAEVIISGIALTVVCTLCT
jgi:hypothetical protein